MHRLEGAEHEKEDFEGVLPQSAQWQTGTANQAAGPLAELGFACGDLLEVDISQGTLNVRLVKDSETNGGNGNENNKHKKRPAKAAP